MYLVAERFGTMGVGEAREILATTKDERHVSDDGTPARWYARRGIAMQLGLVALLVILFFALGVVVKSGRTLAFDERAHRFIRGPVPTQFEEDDFSLRTRFMRLGPDIGTATLLFVPFTVLALIGIHRRRAAAVMIASPVGALILTLCLKGVFQRTRADHACHHGPLCVIGYLYPSTHTVLTIVTYGMIGAVIAARLSRGWQALVILFVIVIIGFVAVSLVYLNTHYLTDVIGGFLIGSAWLILSVRILRNDMTNPRISRGGRMHWGTRLS
ncbi:MAG: phosphatase PAP2 family protein [Thermomicrobiales bacterium]